VSEVDVTIDMFTFASLPDRINDEDELDEILSRPTEALVEDMAHLEGDVIILGVGGKIGPTLARMAKRAAPNKRIIGVARFSNPIVRKRLESWGIEALTCDLLDRRSVDSLPKLPNVVFMAGKKFGTANDPSFAWAMNTYVPSLVGEAFGKSRIVAFSTLCVYPFGSVVDGGWREDSAPDPLGEYGSSCVGRERIFQFFSARNGTPGRLIRLNYAIDLRYGVLFDVATWVRTGTPIPISTGHANVIWQGDASAHTLRALRHCTRPTTPLNVGGPQATSIRWLAHAFGKRFGRAPVFEGCELSTAWVNDTAQAQALFGLPLMPVVKMVDWVADWIERAMPAYGKPTRYEVRDGTF
jgi:hypothetical protein